MELGKDYNEWLEDLNQYYDEQEELHGRDDRQNIEGWVRRGTGFLYQVLPEHKRDRA